MFHRDHQDPESPKDRKWFLRQTELQLWQRMGLTLLALVAEAILWHNVIYLFKTGVVECRQTVSFHRICDARSSSSMWLTVLLIHVMRTLPDTRIKLRQTHGSSCPYQLPRLTYVGP